MIVTRINHGDQSQSPREGWEEMGSDRSFQCVSYACSEVFENPGKFHSEMVFVSFALLR
jgi:hypothetical protein